jgi:hypothetical protein
MNIPIWAILVVIIIIIAVVFIIFHPSKSKHSKWEDKAKYLVKECGYSSIHKLSVLESEKTYIVGNKNDEGKVTSARIYLCTTKSNGNKYDKNTILTALIHELSHALNPDVEHSDIAFQNTVDKLSLCASQLDNYDPFSKIDDDYPTFN